jgi:signal transduction histidine kinase
MSAAGDGLAPSAYVRIEPAWRRVREAVRRGEYVALVGPKFCGKSMLLRDLLPGLTAEGQHLAVYLDLAPWQVYQPQELFRRLAAAIDHELSHAGHPQASRSPDWVCSSHDLRYYLSAALAASPETVVLALDHVESLPRYLAKDLLRCLRVVFNERTVHSEYERLVVIAAGALNLFKLTISVLSPFNIATLVSLPDAGEKEGLALVQQAAARLGVSFSTGAARHILRQAGGDRYLILRLCSAAAERRRGDRVSAAAVRRAVEVFEQCEPLDEPCLGERIRLVEADAGILTTVLDVLAGREVRRRELLTDIDSAELTGVVQVIRDRYVMRNPLCARLLRRYFTARRVAGLFSTFGRWDDAIRYFEQGALVVNRPERLEYLSAVVNRIEQDDEQELHSFELIAAALVNAFPVSQVVIHRYAEAQHELVVAALRGVAAAQYTPTIPVQGGPDYPQERAFRTDDYLLEKDLDGNSLLLFPMPSGSRLPAVGTVTVMNLFPAERHGECRDEVLGMAGFLTLAGRAIAAQRERQHLLRLERRRAQAFAALSDVTRAITPLHGQSELLSLVVTSARQVLAADVVTLYLYDPGGDCFHSPLADGLRHEAEFMHGPSPDPNGQIAGRIVREGKPLFFEDVAAHPAADRVPFAQRENLRSGAGFPLLRGQQVVGIFFVGYRTHHAFSDDERQIITAFADQAAIAIENARLHTQLQQSKKTLEDWLKVLTHQLQAEPAFVANTLSTLLAGKLGDLTPEQQDRLTKAQQRLERYHQRIDNLRLYGRLVGGRILFTRSVISLRQLIRSVMSGHQGTAERRGLHLQSRLQELPTMEGDESLLRIVLDNLVENAVKFTPTGGHVHVEAWAAGQTIHLAVDDTGPGIPPHDWAKVFDEYYQVRPEHSATGTGLGLYIARRLVHMHAGTVHVCPKDGPGTRIEVVLPLLAPTATGAEPAAPPGLLGEEA